MTPSAPLWNTRRHQFRNRTGNYVRLKAVAFAGRQCECAGAARPAAAEQPSRMKIEPNMRNCLRIDYAEIHNYAEITQSLHSHYAKITQTLRSHYAFITHSLRKDYTDITHSLRRDYAEITKLLRNSISQHYTIRNSSRIPQFITHYAEIHQNYAMGNLLMTHSEFESLAPRVTHPG